MGEARGVLTEEQVKELKEYGGAGIMLLDGMNDTTNSGGTVTGQTNWRITWDNSGFSGQGWTFGNGTGWGAYDYAKMNEDGTLRDFLNSNGFYMLMGGLSDPKFTLESNCVSLGN